jgi:hypothetical protein
MTRVLFLVVLAAWAAVFAGGCGVGDTAQDEDRASAGQDRGAGPVSTAAQPAAGTPPTPVEDRVVATAEPTTPVSSTTQAASPPMTSLAETEALVRADLAATQGLPADQIAVAEAIVRTWPDQGLGCGKRQGVFEPSPVPGYQLTLTYGDKKFIYHADQHGRFLLCREHDKRFGPISRS